MEGILQKCVDQLSLGLVRVAVTFPDFILLTRVNSMSKPFKLEYSDIPVSQLQCCDSK